MKNLFKKYYTLFLYISLLLPTVYLSQENIHRSIILILFLSIWYILTVIRKNKLSTTLLFLLFLIPFNITLQLPQSVEMFSTSFNLYQPYVSGLWVNYLVPTLSVLDMFVFIFLIQALVEKKKILKGIVLNKYLIIFFLMLVVHNIFVQDFITLHLTVRLYGYFITTLLVKEIFFSGYKFKDLLYNRYVNLLLTTSILLQGAIGLYQFLRGVSLGVFFLGESKVVSGMFGSSFVEINGESFLRAYGTFPHPNILAGWYILCIVFSLLIYAYTKNKWSFINIALVLLFITFTFSRISIFLLVVILLVYIFKYVVSKRGTYSLSSLLWFRFLNIFTGDDHSLGDRIELLKVNIGVLKNNLLLGTGLGNSIKGYSENIPITHGGKLLLQPVHNVWLLSLVELGIFFGIYYLYLIYRFLIKGTKWNILNITVLLGILLIGSFDHYFFTLPQGQAIFYSLLILIPVSKL